MQDFSLSCILMEGREPRGKGFYRRADGVRAASAQGLRPGRGDHSQAGCYGEHVLTLPLCSQLRGLIGVQADRCYRQCAMQRPFVCPSIPGAGKAPAINSQERYGFPAREICVTSGRVYDYWNAEGTGLSRSPELAGSSPASRVLTVGYWHGKRDCPGRFPASDAR